MSFGPRSCLARMAAPAPSPQKTQVLRSFQFAVRVIISAATTRIWLQASFRRYCWATFRANTNPEQAAVISKATAWSAPNLAWSQFAPDGQWVSGVMVAIRIISKSLAVNPAALRACWAASRARSEVTVSASAILLSRMPVR